MSAYIQEEPGLAILNFQAHLSFGNVCILYGYLPAKNSCKFSIIPGFTSASVLPDPVEIIIEWVKTYWSRHSLVRSVLAGKRRKARVQIPGQTWKRKYENISS